MTAVILATLIGVLPLTPAGPARVLALRPPPAIDPLHDQAELEHSFRDGLRIQLWGRATLHDGPRPLQGTTAEARVWEAAGQLGTAAVAFWLERTGPQTHALYVVGRRRGRAVVDIFDLPTAGAGAGAGEGGRALALKVSEAIDDLLFAPPPPDRNTWLDSPRVPPAVPVMIFEAGVGVRDSNALRSAAQGLAAVALAQRRPLPRLGMVVELAGEAEVTTGREGHRAGGVVETSEAALAVAARALLLRSRFLAGGYAALGLTMIHAQGTTREGARGSERLWIPTGALGADVRWRITSRLELRLTGQAGAMARRQLLAINDVAVLDLGRFELSGRLSLVFVSR